MVLRLLITYISHYRYQKIIFYLLKRIVHSIYIYAFKHETNLVTNKMKFQLLCILLVVGVSFAFECTPGVPYKENDCNGCFCTPSRLLACTEMGCFGQKYKDMMGCVVGTKSKQDCNDCECVENMGTICTNNPC
ncbi:hypothetical protein FQR65_LT06797 [Abscondita terminalis]|nr:hypothetical protein FQR65_LT06797 [Abscondita terminalis]